jgi:hypothetical protein
MKKYLAIWKFNNKIIINGGTAEAYEAVAILVAKDLESARVQALKIYPRAVTFPNLHEIDTIKKDTRI